ARARRELARPSPDNRDPAGASPWFRSIERESLILESRWSNAGPGFEHARLAIEQYRRACAADVFDIFLDRFDVFYLSRVSGVWLPGGRPIFRGIPPNTPEEVLTLHGMSFLRNEVNVDGLTIASWRRSRRILSSEPNI